MAQNRMVLNAERTSFMHVFGTDNKTRSAGSTHVTLSNTVITTTSLGKAAGML